MSGGKILEIKEKTLKETPIETPIESTMENKKENKIGIATENKIETTTGNEIETPIEIIAENKNSSIKKVKILKLITTINPKFTTSRIRLAYSIAVLCIKKKCKMPRG